MIPVLRNRPQKPRPRLICKACHAAPARPGCQCCSETCANICRIAATKRRAYR